MAEEPILIKFFLRAPFRLLLFPPYSIEFSSHSIPTLFSPVIHIWSQARTILFLPSHEPSTSAPSNGFLVISGQRWQFPSLPHSPRATQSHLQLRVDRLTVCIHANLPQTTPISRSVGDGLWDYVLTGARPRGSKVLFHSSCLIVDKRVCYHVCLFNCDHSEWQIPEVAIY